MSLLRCTFIFSWVSREDQDVMEKRHKKIKIERELDMK
jgi:hypothetical protein